MGGTARRFTVTRRFQVTWNGVWMFAACLVFSVTGVALIVRGETTDILFGVVALVMFGGGGALAVSPVLSPRPVLVLDNTGVRIVAPWPRLRSGDLVVPWEDLTLVRAVTRVVPHRGSTMLMHYLVFVPRGAVYRDFPLPAPWEPSYAVQAHATWDHTIDEIVAESHQH